MADPVSSVSLENRVVFEYIKSQHFRVAHVDGGIGGPTPAGFIHLAVFSERAAIPRRLVMQMKDGKVGEVIPSETIVREGMVREIDIDLMMSAATAKELASLLNRLASPIEEKESGGANNDGGK